MLPLPSKTRGWLLRAAPRERSIVTGQRPVKAGSRKQPPVSSFAVTTLYMRTSGHPMRALHSASCLPVLRFLGATVPYLQRRRLRLRKVE